jgi:hypothetical protein
VQLKCAMPLYGALQMSRMPQKSAAAIGMERAESSSYP